VFFLKKNPPGNICPQCTCNSAWIYLLAFTIAYVATNFTQLGVVKYGNATFSFIVSTLVTPVAEFVFAWKLIMGSQVESLSMYNYIALGILLVGVIIYRYFELRKQAAQLAELKAKGEEIDVNLVTAIPAYGSIQPTFFSKKVSADEAARLRANESHWTFP